VGKAAKQRAEKVYERRGRHMSTLVCLKNSQELVGLASEVFNMQSDFERQPNDVYTTKKSYRLLYRGGKNRQNVEEQTSTFDYKVKLENELFVMDHFEDA
jgi:hypothetical protein